MAEQIKKILVVEDDTAMRQIVTHKLLASGFDVKEAENGKRGLEIFNEIKPDLIVLDLMIPEIDGFGVLEAIRKNADRTLAKTPIIILSNLWSNEDILRTQSLKVDGYLVKAYFTPADILGKIKEILAKK